MSYLDFFSPNFISNFILMGSKLILIIIFVIGLFIPNNFTEVLYNCHDDIIYPSIDDTVICENSCDNIKRENMRNCNIKCNSTGSCIGIKVYSGSLNTIISCFGEETCKNSEIYIGNTGHYPDFLNIETYLPNTQNFVGLICRGNRSCQNMIVKIKGHVNEGGFIDLNGFGSQKLQDSSLSVTTITNDGHDFILKCGTDKTNCKNVTYTCGKNNCYCTGYCPVNMGPFSYVCVCVWCILILYV